MAFGLYNALYGQIVKFCVHYQITTVHKKKFFSVVVIAFSLNFLNQIVTVFKRKLPCVVSSVCRHISVLRRVRYSRIIPILSTYES